MAKEIKGLFNHSFAGTDIQVYVYCSQPDFYEILNEVQTISISAHRELFPARVLGKTSPVEYTYGPRTIGGSMVLTVINESPMMNLVRKLYEDSSEDLSERTTGQESKKTTDQESPGKNNLLLKDSFPPLTFLLSFFSEYGTAGMPYDRVEKDSKIYFPFMKIQGIRFINDGYVMSIEDIITENTLTFVADSCTPIMVPEEDINQAQNFLKEQDGYSEGQQNHYNNSSPDPLYPFQTLI